MLLSCHACNFIFQQVVIDFFNRRLEKEGSALVSKNKKNSNQVDSETMTNDLEDIEHGSLSNPHPPEAKDQIASNRLESQCTYIFTPFSSSHCFPTNSLEFRRFLNPRNYTSTLFCFVLRIFIKAYIR